MGKMGKRTNKVKIISFFISIGILFFSRDIYGDGAAGLILESLGVLLLIFGAFGRAWASGYISGHKNKDLVTDGPYSLIRNPLYFFSFISFLGVGLVFRSGILTIAFGGLFFYTHWRTILKEEKKLKVIFGDSFEAYITSVPRFIPKSLKIVHPKQISFSSSHFTKSLVECALILTAIIGANIISWLHLHEILPVIFPLV